MKEKRGTESCTNPALATIIAGRTAGKASLRVTHQFEFDSIGTNPLRGAPRSAAHGHTPSDPRLESLP